MRDEFQVYKPMTDLFRSLLQQATSQGARSTALNPLAWAMAIVLSTLAIVARIVGLSGWVLVLLGTFAGLFVVAFLAAYFILLFMNPDALRSERFTLSKMAIERSVTGDSLKGFTDAELVGRDILQIPAEATGRRELPQ